MNCYYSRRLINPIKEENLTGFDKYKIVIPCGKCAACRKQKANDWLVRSYFEFLGNNKQAFFVTLTFDEQHLPRYKGKPCFDMELLKAFHSRLRGKISSYRYFQVCEYGGFLRRPHHHLLILPNKSIDKAKLFAAIDDAWWYGEKIDVELIDSVQQDKLKALSYIAGYTTKDITFDLTVDNPDMPLRYRPQTRASKGFGLRALEECLITPEDVLRGNKISLPIGKNGALRKFDIPRYYVQKLAYDYTWDRATGTAHLKKNSFGVELDKLIHNGRYVYNIRDFFSSRHLPLDREPGLQGLYSFSDSWKNVVFDIFDNFSDFKEFMFFRPFIRRFNIHIDSGVVDLPVKLPGNLTAWFKASLPVSSDYYVQTSLFSLPIDRPNWHYYECALQIWESYKSLLNHAKAEIKQAELVTAARDRARYKLRKRPDLVRYLISQHFNFQTLNS